MPGPRDLPAALTKGPFTPAEARDLGVGPDVLRGRRFSAPFYGVRTPSAWGDDLEQRCLALAAVLPTAAFSHETAARLHGLPLPRREDRPLVVTTPLGVRPPRRPGVRGHCADLTGRVSVLANGLRVVDVPCCWAQLSALLDLPGLVAVGDAALRRGLTTTGLLAGTTSWPGYRRGRRNRRTALPLLDGRAESPMESVLRVLLVTEGLPVPQVNRDVVEGGEWLARPDLSYPDLRIAIEYEGDHHRTDKRQWRADKTRRRLLEDAGWLVIEVTADDVYRYPDRLVTRVRAAVRARSAFLR